MAGEGPEAGKGWIFSNRRDAVVLVLRSGLSRSAPRELGVGLKVTFSLDPAYQGDDGRWMAMDARVVRPADLLQMANSTPSAAGHPDASTE